MKIEWAREARATLEGAGLDVCFSAYPHLQHSTSLEEMDEVAAFLCEHLQAEAHAVS